VSAETRTASGAPGPDVLRPPGAGHLTTAAGRVNGRTRPTRRRQSHPDFPPPEILPLFDELPRPAWPAADAVAIQGVRHRVEPVEREPGDEARTLYRLTPEPAAGQGGAAVALAADCGAWHECDCAEFRSHGWDCRHLRALVEAGWLEPPPRLGMAAACGVEGGASW
jgi:hypothetical protein